MITISQSKYRVVINKNKFNNIIITYYSNSQSISEYVIDINNQVIIDFYYKPRFKLMLKTSEMFDWEFIINTIYLLTLNEVGKLKLL